MSRPFLAPAALAPLIAFLLSGCHPSAPAPPPPPPSLVFLPATPPVAESTPVEADAPPPSKRDPLPAEEPLTVEHRSNALVITGSSEIESIAVIPGGVAFTYENQILRARFGTEKLEEVANVIDPHALATDGSTLYWFGDEANGRLDLTTLERRSIPSFALAGERLGLAVGDAVYALVRRNEVWRLEGQHLEQVETRGKPGWLVLHLSAADRLLVLSVIDPSTHAKFIWRLPLRGKGLALEGASISSRLASLERRGALIFVRGEQVLKLDAKAKTPRELFDEPGIQALCWCGKDVCALSETNGELRKHRGTTADYDVIAHVEGSPKRIACDASQVALTTHDRKRTSLHVITLDAAE